MGSEKKLQRSILIAFTIETLCATWLLKLPGCAPFLSLPYFVSGIGISCCLLFLPGIRFPSPARKEWMSPINGQRLVLLGLVALMLYSWSLYWFDEMPIDISNADMLPIIKVMGQRFLAGQHSHVYDPIPWIWKGVQPIYLPAMWLPYVPAIVLGIDMRWVTIASLLFAFGAFLFLFRPSTAAPQPDAGPRLSASAANLRPSGAFLLAVLAFLLFWWVVADNTPGIISVAEEGTVIAYFVLLVLALASGRPWLTGIAISLCMLSRYALVGWIPAYLIYLVLEKKWRYLWIITLTGIGCFVLLFLLPVGWSTFIRLARLPGNYIAFAGRVWKDSPDVFSTAPGFAWFFGPERIGILHGCLLILSFACPLLFMLIAWNKKKSGNKPVANIPLASLKLSLVIFYCFIDVPYLYLFYTSSFVSLIILSMTMRKNEQAAMP